MDCVNWDVLLMEDELSLLTQDEMLAMHQKAAKREEVAIAQRDKTLCYIVRWLTQEGGGEKTPMDRMASIRAGERIRKSLEAEMLHNAMRDTYGG